MAGKILEFRGKFQRRIFGAAKSGLLACFDQGLISGSNFILSAVLARTLSQTNYGTFALGVSIFLLISLSHQALVLEPLSVIAPAQQSWTMHEYVGVMLRVHVVLSALLVMCAGIAAFGTWLAGSASMTSALLGVCVCTPCVLLLWMTRRCFYTYQQPAHAAMGALLYCGLMFSAIAFLQHWHRLSPFTAFAAMGGAALITGVIQLGQLRPARVRLPWRPILERHWTYGKWALATCFLAWIPSNAYYSFLGWFSGVSSAASFKALQNVSAPITQVQSALT